MEVDVKMSTAANTRCPSIATLGKVELSLFATGTRVAGRTITNQRLCSCILAKPENDVKVVKYLQNPPLKQESESRQVIGS